MRGSDGMQKALFAVTKPEDFCPRITCCTC